MEDDWKLMYIFVTCHILISRRKCFPGSSDHSRWLKEFDPALFSSSLHNAATFELGVQSWLSYEIITITFDLSGRHNLGVNKDINIGKGKEYFCTKEKKSDILLRLRINTLAEYRTDSNPTFGGSHFQFSHVNLIRPSRNLRPNVKIISFFFTKQKKRE